MSTIRVVGYVDGFNLYYGLKSKGWGQLYWLDPYKLIEVILGREYSIETVKYFTARVKSPDGKRNRQSAFLDAVRASSDAETILGKFYPKDRKCKSCAHKWTTFEEKMTDSAIASHLVADAFLDTFDVALLIGGDTDIIPAVKLVRRHFPKKRLFAWFPPNRKNQAVADSCHDDGQINGEHLRQSLMPESVETSDGVTISKPSQWVYKKPQ